MKQDKPKFSFRYLFIALVAIAVFAATANAAYIKIANVNNNFKPAVSIIPDIIEDFDGTVKEDVYFNIDKDDEGKKDDPVTDYPVYVRAAIVITWQNAQGIIYYKPVNPEDYEMVLNEEDWTLRSDGFYYYKEAVESNGNTSVFIEKCRQINPAPVEGYTLSIDIIVQTIQAVGYTDGEDNMDDENDTGKIPAWDDAGWKVFEQTTEPPTEPPTEP